MGLAAVLRHDGVLSGRSCRWMSPNTRQRAPQAGLGAGCRVAGCGLRGFRCRSGPRCERTRWAGGSAPRMGSAPRSEPVTRDPSGPDGNRVSDTTAPPCGEESTTTFRGASAFATA